jgi:dipeptidyl aminopeptidase/acylaminoacyl peptidase
MTTSIQRRFSRFMSLLAAAVLIACGGSEPAGPSNPPPGNLPVATVSVSPAEASVTVGQQVELSAIVKDAQGTVVQRPIVWHSSAPTVATVSEQGVVTTLGVGEVRIGATSEGRQGVAEITVTAVPVASVRLNVDADVELEWDGRRQLGAVALDVAGNELPERAVTWTSSHQGVATVGNDGLVVALGDGVTTVTASVEGVSAGVVVRVRPVPVANVVITIEEDGLEVGDLVFVGANVIGVNGQTIQRTLTWASTAPGVATVASSTGGLAGVHAIATGTTTITATADGVSGSMPIRITPRPTHDLIYTRWSNLGGTAEIFTLGLDGSPTVPVRLNAGSVSRDPSPSPDGTRFVFAVSQTDLATGQPQHDLYVVNRNGLNMRRLTSMPGVEDEPAWSPDGTRILFHAVDAVTQRSDLWVVNVDGTGLVNLTAGIDASMTDKRSPSWSPGGSRIAFIGAVNGQHKVWTMNANGTSPVQLTRDAGFDSSPTWAPDGQRIAFTRWNTGQPSLGEDIMIVPLATGVPQRLAQFGDQRSPVWSPDGLYIAFAGTEQAGRGESRLYTMRPDGTGLRLRSVNVEWGNGTSPSWIRR